MKRNLLLIACAACFATSAVAQKINAAKLPMAVKQAFEKAYPTALKTIWDKEGKDFEASFKNGKESLSVVFDAKGTIIETEKTITAADLPAAVQTAMKGKKIKEAAEIIAHGEVYYEAEAGGKDYLFDAQGKTVKKLGE